MKKSDDKNEVELIPKTPDTNFIDKQIEKANDAVKTNNNIKDAFLKDQTVTVKKKPGRQKGWRKDQNAKKAAEPKKDLFKLDGFVDMLFNGILGGRNEIWKITDTEKKDLSVAADAYFTLKFGTINPEKLITFTFYSILLSIVFPRIGDILTKKKAKKNDDQKK